MDRLLSSPPNLPVRYRSDGVSVCGRPSLGAAVVAGEEPVEASGEGGGGGAKAAGGGGGADPPPLDPPQP
ncbi:MAG: hypothetical protein U0939_25450 [Pirellulales bacterium]